MRFQLISDLEASAPASLQDRALHYGDGLFETMLMQGGQIALWDSHYRRLAASAERLGIACPGQAQLDDALRAYAGLDRDLVIKLILSRGIGGRGLSLPDNPQPVVYLLHYAHDAAMVGSAIKATRLERVLVDNPRLAGIKHLNRLDYILASQRLAQRGEFNEAVLEDQHGFVVEGIVHNLFFTLDGRIHTPGVDTCGVAGVMRDTVVKRLKQAGKHVTIGRYRWADLQAAESIVYCNSVQGIRPVIAVDGETWRSAPLVNELQALFHADQTA